MARTIEEASEEYGQVAAENNKRNENSIVAMKTNEDRREKPLKFAPIAHFYNFF